MPKKTIRLTDAIDKRIQSAAKLRGYSTPFAFVRAAIKRELDEAAEGSTSNEKLVGYISEVRRDVRRIERAQQALFCPGGQLSQSLRHLRSRATWRRDGARTG